MRIAYVVPRCTTENSHGRYILGMARALSRDHDVHIFSAAFPSGGVCSVSFRRVPLPNWPTVARLASWWALSPPLVRRDRFDVVHTLGGDAPVGTVVTAPCCNRGIRLALRTAGLDGRGLGERRAPWLASLTTSVGETADRLCMTHRRVRRVLAPSRQVARELETLYGVPAAKLTIVPWGVNVETFSPEARHARRALARQRFGYERDDVVCVYVGEAYRLKGLLTLLEALRRVTGARVRLLVVGAGRNRELAAEEERGLTGRLSFAGPLRDVLEAYAAADMLVLPTLYEGFSLATLEAMACGLPVVVSQCAGIADLLTDGEDAILVRRPTDPEEIARALTRLVADADLRFSLSQAARASAERCSWTHVAQRVQEVYGQVAGQDGH